MKVVMKVVLQTDSQMRKYKQTNKKVKKRKMAFKNATERRHVFLRETEQFLASVNLPSDDSLPFVTFVLPKKDGKKKKDETPDRRLIYIYGHTTAKNPMT